MFTSGKVSLLTCALILTLLTVCRLQNQVTVEENYSRCLDNITQSKLFLCNLSVTCNTLNQEKWNRKLFELTPICNRNINFILYLTIIQCGDVEIQPGPCTAKFPCGICQRMSDGMQRPFSVMVVMHGTIATAARLGPAPTYQPILDMYSIWYTNTSSCYCEDLAEFSEENQYDNLNKNLFDNSINFQGLHSSTPMKHHIIPDKIAIMGISRHSSSSPERAAVNSSAILTHSGSISSET